MSLYNECQIASRDTVQAIKSTSTENSHDQILNINIPTVTIVFGNRAEAEQAFAYCQNVCPLRMCLSEIAGKNCNQVVAHVCDHYEIEQTGISSFQDKNIKGIAFRNLKINSK